MIWDVNEIRGPAFPKDGGCVVDALGRMLFPLAWCDTETGECGRYEIRPDGTWVLDESGRAKVAAGKYPAPLRREPRRDGPVSLAPYLDVAPYLDADGKEYVPA